jgi:hypothetical protein
LIAGKKLASEAFPALSEVLFFLRPVYISKTGIVRKIHTGYNGHAIGKYYEVFAREFNNDFNDLLISSNRKTGKL